MKTIIFNSDVRLLCPRCGWNIHLSRKGLHIVLVENDGELPVHEKCKVRLIVEEL